MKVGQLRIVRQDDGSYEGVLQLFGRRLVIAGRNPDDVEWKMRELGAIK